MIDFTERDLTGALRGFPIEVVKLMLIRQFEQTGSYSIPVFRRNINRGRDMGGFDWTDTPEGGNFWAAVVGAKDFATFYNIYPDGDLSEVTLSKKICQIVYGPIDNPTTISFEILDIANQGNILKIVAR